MKLLKVILSILLAFIALWVIVAFFSPKNIGIKETIVIEQSANSIYNQVNDLKKWKNWSEWNRRDSSMLSHYSTPSIGEKASVRWESKKEGNGSQEIIESIPYEKIRLSVSIEDQREHFSLWEFNELEEFKTEVTWTFEESEINFFLRPMGFSINNMISEYYKAGLENLKLYSENLPLQNKKLRPQLIEADAIFYIGKHIVSDQIGIKTQLENAHKKLIEICSTNNWYVHGMPMSINYIIEKNVIEIELALQIDTIVVAPRGFISGIVKGGEAVRVSHFGMYKNLHASLHILDNWISNNGYVKDGYSYGIYVNDRSQEADSSKWETQLVYLIDRLE